MVGIKEIKEFERITGFNLLDYFQRCQYVISNDYNLISDYYKGMVDSIGADSFKRFELVDGLTKECLQQFYINSDKFNNLKWWDILEQIEELDSRFMTLKNMNRWARSSAKNFGFDTNPRFDYVLTQKQTLERISSDFLKSDNSNDDWFDIAIDNDLIEEDYTSDGGTIMKLTLPKQLINFDITSIADVIEEKSVYGKDLNKYITFENDDLQVLSYEDTILQASDILVSLKKGDNPDQPQIGLQRSVLLGVSKSNFNIPILTRQLTETFKTDDSMKNFTINDVKFNQDMVEIQYSVQTRLGEVINQSSIL